MKELAGFPKATQAKTNSCWACASRMIVNWYNGRKNRVTRYESDQAIANAWGAKMGDEYKSLDVQRSASGLLIDLGYSNNTDGRPKPTISEIEKAIVIDQKPLLANVAPGNPGNTPNLKVKNDGHWVVIVGVDVDTSKLKVFDPGIGAFREVDYGNEYDRQEGEARYWQNTSYVDDLSS